MNPQRLTERVSVEASLLEWMGVQGNIALGLRHPNNVGHSREMMEQFAMRLVGLLIERGVLTREEGEEACKFEVPADAAPMSDDRFNELLNGPLSHPVGPLFLTRIATALRIVVAVTGTAGAQALERHCAAVQAHDEAGGD